MRKAIKRTLETLLLTSTIFLNCYRTDKADSSSPFYIEKHVNSCGPESISSTLSKFNINISTTQISYDIIKNNELSSTIRELLSNINKDANKITWPWEVYNSLEKNLPDNHKITFFYNNPDSLKTLFENLRSKNKKMLLLISDKSNYLRYHWITEDKDPLNYYNDNTIISQIYLIEN